MEKQLHNDEFDFYRPIYSGTLQEKGLQKFAMTP